MSKSNYSLGGACLLLLTTVIPDYKLPDDISARSNEGVSGYLLDSTALRSASANYTTTISHALWFKLNNYFGLHFATDKSYQWLGKMCDTFVDLNPYEEHVYEFCALMLAWEAEQPKEADDVLTKGIAALPNSWKLRLVRGIQSRIFFGNNQAARDDFRAGAEVPNAPAYMGRLAAKTMANLNDPNEAVQFLKQLIHTSKDPAQKQALTQHLQRTEHAINIKYLEDRCAQYTASNGTHPQTLADCTTKKLLDPLGAEYTLDATTQKVKSSSKLQPATLFAEHIKSNKPIASPFVNK